MDTSPAWNQRAFEALRQSGVPALRRIQVQQIGDSVVITGRVDSYYHKQLAQEAIMQLATNRPLVNQLTVAR